MLMGLSSFAQITVDSTSIVGPGMTKYMAIDESPSNSISIGSASSIAQNWDFNTLIADVVDTLNFISPSSALYPPTISGVNLSLNFDYDDMTMHLRNDATGLYLLEFVGPFGSIPVSETIANFPMTYGDNFTWSFVIDTIIENTVMPMPGADLVRYRKDTSNISEVDAWGAATTPLGSFDVIRVKNDASSIDSVWVKSFPTSHQIQTVGITFDPDTLSINVLDTVFFTGLGYHDVTEVDESTYLSNGATSNGGFTYLFDNFHVFTEPGTYYYVCSPHASMGMKGMITVVDDWTFFQTSSNFGEPYYTFWTDNANDAGLPILTVYTDGSGNISDVEFLNDGSEVNNTETWDCIAGGCIDPGDGTGEYEDIVDCEYQCVSSYLNDENIHETTAYPNPTSSKIEFNLTHLSEIKIFNSNGELVYFNEINPEEKINISKFENGLYFFQILNNTITKTGKFQKIK